MKLCPQWWHGRARWFTTALLCCCLAWPAHGQNPDASAPADGRNAAAVALFVNSNLDSARTLAKIALRQNPQDPDALFVEMEAAAMEANVAGELDAALRLCSISTPAQDARLTVAAGHIVELAGNTAQFRAVIPRIQLLTAPEGTSRAGGMAVSACSEMLSTALVAVATEGAPGLSAPALARDAGLLTNWRVAGPFGKYANVAFDRRFPPERDHLSQPSYPAVPPAPTVAVERFQFDDGNFELADYFPRDGIFYAASEVELKSSGEYAFRVETDGTLDLFVDGTRVLHKDDRFRATPQVVRVKLQLSAGRHDVLVKFLPSAAPFRIALMPVAPGVAHAVPTVTEPEAAYLAAAERYWAGDYDAAISRLTALHNYQPSAAVDFLLAQAWDQAAPDSPEKLALFHAVLKTAPLALAAEYKLAEYAYDNHNLDEAFRRVQRIVERRPEYAPAQELLASIARQMNWPSQATKAFAAALRLHPVCSTLRSAADFFSSISAYGHAAELERQLDGCAPGSLAYAEALRHQGRHAEAAAAAQKIVLQHPMDREARTLLARELASAAQPEQARRVAVELAAMAPNSAPCRHLAAQLAAGSRVLDETSPRARQFISGGPEFYSAYRRNGLEIIRKTAKRHFSGGPAVVLIHDQVTRLGEDGSVAVYVHDITRVLNRDGIEKYGEVLLPPGADLLELRTIQQDGTVVEPEFNRDKITISMPALAPGAAIEQEYVVRHAAGGISRHPEAFRFTFGSFKAPILYARFVVLTPDSGIAGAPDDLQIISSGSIAAPAITTSQNTVIRVWQAENILQSTREVSAVKGAALPSVRVLAKRVGGWQDLRDSCRDKLIDAVRIGPRVQALAQTLKGTTPEATARNLYRLVTTRLHGSESNFVTGDIATAESTLANYTGSRTAALLALSRAAGLDAELLLAREIGQSSDLTPDAPVYTHPLVYFRFAKQGMVADAEREGLAFGAIPPTLVQDGALFIPVAEPEGTQAARPQHLVSGYPDKLAALLVPLPPSSGDEHSMAEGDASFDADGNLSARIRIRMGSSRSAQMRSILHGIAPAERKHFFEQLALRIFPGTTEADGEVSNEQDAEHPLELLLTCRAPHYLVFTDGLAEMDQLVPALGLLKMYGTGPRRSSLLIDTPLVETTVLHIHLPAGVQVETKPPDVRLNNEFGAYTAEFDETGPGEMQVRRAFRVPVQVISPERFQDFAEFAHQVADVEGQRITLARPSSMTSTASSPSGLAP